MPMNFRQNPNVFTSLHNLNKLDSTGNFLEDTKRSFLNESSTNAL